MDPDKGYAVGSVNVIKGTIPVIITDYQMSPLDVFIINNTTLPLNEYFLQKYYQKPEAFVGLAGNPSATGLFGTQNALQFSPSNEYSQAGTSRVTREAVKMASVFDSITYIHPDDAKAVLEEAKDPQVFKMYKKAGTDGSLIKIASIAKKSSLYEDFSDSFLRNLPVDRQLVQKDSDGNYLLKQANSKVGKTWVTKLALDEKEGITPFIGAPSRTLEKKAEATTQTNYISLKPGNTGDLEYDSAQLGTITVTSIEAVEHLPKFASFKVAGDEKYLLFNAKGEYSYKNGNNPLASEDFLKIAGDTFRVGDYGSFVTPNEITKPFEITSITKVAGTDTNLTIEGIEGFRKVAYNIGKLQPNKPIEKIANSGEYLISKNAKFVKLKQETTKMAELRAFEAKIKVEGLHGMNKVAFYISENEDLSNSTPVYAAEKLSLTKTDVIGGDDSAPYEKTAAVSRDTSGLYSFNGEEFFKYAEFAPISSLSLSDAQ